MLLVATAAPQPKGFKLYIPDDLVFVNIQINTHDVAALGISHRSYAAWILKLSYVSGMFKMIHYFFTI